MSMKPATQQDVQKRVQAVTNKISQRISTLIRDAQNKLNMIQSHVGQSTSSTDDANEICAATLVESVVGTLDAVKDAVTGLSTDIAGLRAPVEVPDVPAPVTSPATASTPVAPLPASGNIESGKAVTE